MFQKGQHDLWSCRDGRKKTSTSSHKTVTNKDGMQLFVCLMQTTTHTQCQCHQIDTKSCLRAWLRIHQSHNRFDDDKCRDTKTASFSLGFSRPFLFFVLTFCTSLTVEIILLWQKWSLSIDRRASIVVWHSLHLHLTSAVGKWIEHRIKVIWLLTGLNTLRFIKIFSCVARYTWIWWRPSIFFFFCTFDVQSFLISISYILSNSFVTSASPSILSKKKKKGSLKLNQTRNFEHVENWFK